MLCQGAVFIGAVISCISFSVFAQLLGFLLNPAVPVLMVQVVLDAGERELLPWCLFSKGGSLGDCACPCWGFRDQGSHYYYFIVLIIIIIIIFTAIIEAYSPFCCSWMCPWLGIVLSQHPATASLISRRGVQAQGWDQSTSPLPGLSFPALTPIPRWDAGSHRQIGTNELWDAPKILSGASREQKMAEVQ